MTLSSALALARDLLILAALAFIGYKIYTAGENTVKVADIQALQKQLAANAQTQAQWQQEAQRADLQRSEDLAQVSATIAAQRQPVFVRGPSSTCPVSQPAAQAPSRAPAAGGDVVATGEDLRPAVNAFELRLETVIEDCRAALDQWP